ncbi:MAG: TVP38/TMEM64 family protein [Alphaproteobacteria bacterium]|nr:TVP38/TMEM64 family protein [Alphaproteobacteria bacterium]
MTRTKKLLPLVGLIAVIAVIFLTGIHRYLSFDTLREHREALTGFVTEHGVVAGLLFVAIYAVAVACSVPGATILTVTGGFLFGPVLGTTANVIGATIGATALFLIARTSLGEPLRQRAGPALQKLEAGFRENAFSYLLVLRLIPLFPFFIVNLVPAFLGVSTRTFVLATLVGIIPGGFVYTLVGAGLGSVFDRQEAFTLTGVLTPEIIAALLGLAILALLPVAYKKLRARRSR